MPARSASVRAGQAGRRLAVARVGSRPAEPRTVAHACQSRAGTRGTGRLVAGGRPVGESVRSRSWDERPRRECAPPGCGQRPGCLSGDLASEAVPWPAS